MRKGIWIAVLIFVLVLTACGGDEVVEETITPISTTLPVVPTPLPTAVPPDSVSGGNWVISFQYDFPESFWITGDHTYGFKIVCPGLYDYSTEWIFFRVSENVTVQPEPVYLRINGLSSDPFRPAYLSENRINPEQPTAAVVHLVGLSEEQVEDARKQCEVLVAWDRATPQVLEIADVFEQ